MQRSEWLAKCDAILAELRGSLEHADVTAFQDLASALLAARRVVLHGLGREGLQMKGLAMRLFHLGLDAHVVGEMTTPAIGKAIFSSFHQVLATLNQSGRSSILPEKRAQRLPSSPQ
jgi:D-arabinose 5-phosphate isomerase GutQ